MICRDEDRDSRGPARGMTMKDLYQPVTPEVVEALVHLVGERHIVHADRDRLLAYSHDEAGGPDAGTLPEAVVFPGSAKEISAILRLGNRECIPVTPRGAGSGLSCGAEPVCGGIVLSLARMDRIIEIDPANMTATVEAGVITNRINDALKEYGLFYAGYPMSQETCYIGGNVAENAGGGRAVKYGVTARHVCGLEVVLPTGEILELGGKRVKDVTGYNLLQLMVGSEGTLGIFTRVVLRLVPLPRFRAALLAPFRTVREAIDMVPTIMTQKGVIPSALEFMDRLSVETSYGFLEEPFPYDEAGAVLLIEVDGGNEDQVAAEYEAVGQLCIARSAIDVFVADNRSTLEKVWKIRGSIAEAFKISNPVQTIEDIVVPVGRIPELVRDIETLAAAHALRIPCYGHAGDGNLHATLLMPPDMDAAKWNDLKGRVLSELYVLTANHGGTISGEHGIGSKRRNYLPLVLSPETIALMRRIKAAFDPNGILNPGKLLPDYNAGGPIT